MLSYTKNTKMRNSLHIIFLFRIGFYFLFLLKNCRLDINIVLKNSTCFVLKNFSSVQFYESN